METHKAYRDPTDGDRAILLTHGADWSFQSIDTAKVFGRFPTKEMCIEVAQALGFNIGGFGIGTNGYTWKAA